MKFLCDRCKTRYSIGDDRVRGKILKIRCKNCANVITVREGMVEAEEPSQGGPRRSAKPTTLAPPAQVAAPTNGAKPPAALEEEWYVSIDGEQSGPFSLHEAQRWIGDKPPTADLHCWSEGFDDWLPVDKVSHFRGLRKRAATPAPAPPAPPPRPVAPVVDEDEPKPLFAATMAAIEKSAAAAAPQSARATPLGGIPSLPKPSTNGTAPHAAIAPRPLPAPSAAPTATNLRQTGGVPAIPATAMKQTGGVPAIPAAAMKQSGGVPAIPSVRGGTGPRPALFDGGARGATGPRPALPFDASDNPDANTQIEVPPFGDDARTAAELAARPRMPTPFSTPVGFAPSTSSATPAPAYTPPPAFPTPAPAALPPASLSGTGANGAMAMAFNPDPRPLPLTPPPPAMPEPEPEGDIEIGEVSRVVNLADLARNHAATKAAASRKSGSLPRLRTTGANPSLNPDPIAAMVATPDAGYTNGAMVAEPAAPPQSHKKLYLLLGIVVLLLLGGVGAVVYAVTQTGNDESTAISQGREVDLTRPDDPLHHNGPAEKPDVKDPTVPHPNNPTHRPYVPPTGSNKNPAIVDPDPTPDTNALKPDEVEAMARTQSEATNRCYMRAQRGADAILVGDVKRINVTITVDKDGAVSTVDLSDHATDSLGKCLQSRIKGWRFHPSAKGLTTRLTLVFQAS